MEWPAAARRAWRNGRAGAVVPDDAVEQLEDAEARLVNDEHDGLAVRGGHVPEHPDNGLVQQQHGDRARGRRSPAGGW